MSFHDDLKSDVPTIAESGGIADMQDFSDLHSEVSGKHHSTASSNLFSSKGSKEFQATPAFFLDTRMHLLGVVCVSPSMQESTDSQSCAVGDLGGCSDVPSVRDDASVASAPSEICVSFPSETKKSLSRSSSISRSGRRSRGTRDHAATRLDQAVAGLDLAERLHLVPEPMPSIMQKPHSLLHSSSTPLPEPHTDSASAPPLTGQSPCATSYQVLSLARSKNSVAALGRRWSTE
jgi:hypothetical protein